MSEMHVVIPTIGRPEVVAAVVDNLAEQTRPADAIHVVGVSAADIAELAGKRGNIIASLSEKGSCKQRNHALREIGGAGDIVLFLDDDFVPAPDYFAEAERMLATRADVVGLTGRLIADGIHTGGIPFDRARAMVAADRYQATGAERDIDALYGCNMVLRGSAIRDHWFDEALPLYGWQEDIDFTYRLHDKGRLIKTDRLAGVHMGVKGGRTSGKRFGYSQVANPLYLLRKKAMPVPLARRLIAQNILSNIARSVRPEPDIDRRGRLWGNMVAVGDLLRGKLDPRRILDFEP